MVNVKIGTNISEKDFNKAKKIVEEEGYINVSDFFREAIREKIRKMENMKNNMNRKNIFDEV